MSATRIWGTFMAVAGLSGLACGGSANDPDPVGAAQNGTAMGGAPTQNRTAMGGAPTQNRTQETGGAPAAAQGGAPAAQGGSGQGGGTLWCYPCYELPTGMAAQDAVCPHRIVDFAVPLAEGTNGYASMSYEVCFNGDCEVFSGKDLPEYPPAGGGVSYSRAVRLPRHDYIEFTFVFESPSSSDSTPSYPLRVGGGSRKTYELKDGDAWSLTIVRADDSVFYEESVRAIYEQRRFRGSGDFANVEASCNALAK